MSSGEREQVLESVNEFYQVRDSENQRAGERMGASVRASSSEFERSARLHVAIQL